MTLQLEHSIFIFFVTIGESFNESHDFQLSNAYAANLNHTLNYHYLKTSFTYVHLETNYFLDIESVLFQRKDD